MRLAPLRLSSVQLLRTDAVFHRKLCDRPVEDGSAFAGVRLGHGLWPHQQRALAAFDRDRAAGESSAYLVIPPGGGKTLISVAEEARGASGSSGTEDARRRRRNGTVEHDHEWFLVPPR
jgi:hypothetical protein